MVDADHPTRPVEERLEQPSGPAPGVDDGVRGVERERVEDDGLFDPAEVGILGAVSVVDLGLAVAKRSLSLDDGLRVGCVHREDVRAASSRMRIVSAVLPAASGWLAPGLAEALSARGATVLESWDEGSRSYALAESPEGRLFGRSSTEPADIAVFEHEAAARALFGRAPRVLASGAGWMLEEAVAPEPFGGAGHVALVVDAAARIQGLELPPAPPRMAHGSTRSLRRLRLLVGPLPVRDLRQAKRILETEELPLVTTHGDFHPRNVLIEEGVAWVVDWELSGRGPVGSDLLHFAAVVDDPADSEALTAAALELAGPEQRAEILRLRYAIFVRAAAAKLATPMGFDRDPAGARRLIERLPEIRGQAGLE